jgi:CheY-like chemotaxis protein
MRCGESLLVLARIYPVYLICSNKSSVEPRLRQGSARLARTCIQLQGLAHKCYKRKIERAVAGPYLTETWNQTMRPFILIIEDDPVQQKLYRVLCNRYNYEVVIFNRSADATQFLKQTESLPDVILIDWFLNGEFGLECITRLKAIAGDRLLPVVTVTANAFEEDRQQCLNAGADDYLAKPFTLDQFTSTIMRWSDAVQHSIVA